VDSGAARHDHSRGDGSVLGGARHRGERTGDAADAQADGALSKKKTIFATERESEKTIAARNDYVARRIAWRDRRLIFFDESGVNISMTRAYGRAPTHERVYGSVPKNWGDNVTLSAGLTREGLIAPLRLIGAMNGEIFEAYIEQFVVPELRPRDIVVMDNLAAHKRASIAALIAEAGAELVYLPPYSPDLNPIEMVWSKVKSVLRTIGARTFEELEEAIVAALRAISPSDAANCIRHAGYAIQ
jgi:transposase